MTVQLQCEAPLCERWFRFAPVTSSLFAYHVYQFVKLELCEPQLNAIVAGGLTTCSYQISQDISDCPGTSMNPLNQPFAEARNSRCLSQICTKSFGVTWTRRIDVGDNKHVGIEARTIYKVGPRITSRKHYFSWFITFYNPHE